MATLTDKETVRYNDLKGTGVSLSDYSSRRYREWT